MKTITKKYKVYTFDELDQKAKDKARELYNSEGDNTPFLTDDLREYIHEELTDKGYKVMGFSTSENPTIQPLYSLSYSQGDGLMFEGTVSDKDGNEFTIKHSSSNYCHSKTAIIEGTDKNGEELADEFISQFTAVYEAICEDIEKRGYDEIEYANSEEVFRETAEANDWLFLKNGDLFIK
jgi:hypothetical protein